MKVGGKAAGEEGKFDMICQLPRRPGPRSTYFRTLTETYKVQWKTNDLAEGYSEGEFPSFLSFLLFLPLPSQANWQSSALNERFYF